jgi:hypothetical protein
VSCGRGQPGSAAHLRARAAMCQICPFASRNPADPLGLTPAGGAVFCRPAGRPVAVMVTAGAARCPKGMHPSDRGLVRWAGLAWMGVPRPVRWALFWWLRGPVPGCGCIEPLKRATLAETAAWDAALETIGMETLTVAIGASLAVAAAWGLDWRAGVGLAGLILMRAGAASIRERKRLQAEATARQEHERRAAEARRQRALEAPAPATAPCPTAPKPGPATAAPASR